jgi:hypothetical protein
VINLKVCRFADFCYLFIFQKQHSKINFIRYIINNLLYNVTIFQFITRKNKELFYLLNSFKNGFFQNVIP